MKCFITALFALGCSLVASATGWSDESAGSRSHFRRPNPFPTVAGTPLAASVIAPPSAVFGTDNRWYLVYEIALLNTSTEDRRVDRVEVLTDDGDAVANYGGATAVLKIMSDAVQVFDGVDVLPASGGGMLWLDVPFERRPVERGRLAQPADGRSRADGVHAASCSASPRAAAPHGHRRVHEVAATRTEQLEGLVGTPDQLRAIREQADLVATLRERGVRYYVGTRMTSDGECLVAEEPKAIQAGAKSPRLTGRFCAKPVFRYVDNRGVATLIFNVAAETPKR